MCVLVAGSCESVCVCVYFQLAVLGACQCRGAGETDPCGCAYAAANLTREVCKLKEEVSESDYVTFPTCLRAASAELL